MYGPWNAAEGKLNRPIHITLSLMIAMIIPIACSKKKGDAPDDTRKIDSTAIEKTAISPASISGAALVISAETTALEVDEGELSGAAVKFSAGAIEVGATISINGAERPASFSESSPIQASYPIEVSGLSPTGEQIKAVTSGLTVNIPLKNLGLLLTENDYASLCILAKPTDTNLDDMVWRREQIFIDNDIAQIQTTQFGVFQAVYCGLENLVDFEEADIDPPEIVGFVFTDPIPGTYNISITFSEDVNGFGLEDLNLQNATASNLNGSGSSYTFDITASTYGDLSFTIPNGSIVDLSGNTNSDPETWENIYTGICGNPNSCYDEEAMKNHGQAISPMGKELVYDFANGTSGFKVWSDKDSNKILRANGKDEWAMKTNPNGKGLNSVEFFEQGPLIVGRVCPDHVFINDFPLSEQFSQNNCLYYTNPGSAQSLDTASTTNDAVEALLEWNFHTNNGDAWWYIGNIKTCSDLGMRLPTIYETTADKDEMSDGYPTMDGNPDFAEGNGVPASDWTWTVSAHASGNTNYWKWRNNQSAASSYSSNSPKVICVLP